MKKIVIGVIALVVISAVFAITMVFGEGETALAGGPTTDGATALGSGPTEGGTTALAAGPTAVDNIEIDDT